MVLSEKLSHYLDLVEVSLLKQISCRSEAFFNALCTIQVCVRECSKGVSAVRE
jgi:vacuolar protein sorting-associated protein 54